MQKLLIGIPFILIGYLAILAGIIGFDYSIHQSEYYGEPSPSVCGAALLRALGLGIIFVASGIYYLVRGSIALGRATSNLGERLNNMKVYYAGISLLIEMIMTLLYPLMIMLIICYIASITAIYAYQISVFILLLVGSLFFLIAISKYNPSSAHQPFTTPQQYSQLNISQSFQLSPQPQTNSYSSTQLNIRPIYSGVIRSNGSFKLILDSSDTANILSIAVQGTDLKATTISPNVLLPEKRN